LIVAATAAAVSHGDDHTAEVDRIVVADDIRTGLAVGHTVLDDNAGSGHGIEIGRLIARIEVLVQKLLVEPLSWLLT